MTDAEFGRLTFAEFELLTQRLEKKREHDYLCGGIVAATVANTHRDAKSKPEPWSPFDFVLSGKKEAVKARVLTPEAQVDAFKALFDTSPRVIRIKE